MDIKTEHDGVFLIAESDAAIYHKHFKAQCLRFNTMTKVDVPCFNFGMCKGETFDRIMIFPNGPINNFILKGIAFDAPEKYYVGVTRPRHSIAIVMKQLPTQLSGYDETVIIAGNTTIRALKYKAQES